jgi:hypothetical protein
VVDIMAEWKKLLEKHDEYNTGEDIADSIGLIVICGLIVAITLFL